MDHKKLDEIYLEFWEYEHETKGLHNPAKFEYAQPFEWRSKAMGFIKRLVNHDKINLDILRENVKFTMFTHVIGCDKERGKTAKESEQILMDIGADSLVAYLAILDKPIDFLISILK